MTTLLHIADRVLNRPLLIMPEKASVIAAILGGRIGIDVAQTQLEPDASRFVGSPATEEVDGKTSRKPFMRTSDGVGIVTVTGSLVNRGAFVGASSGLTSYEGIKFQLASAAADSATRSIVLDLHTPGGEAIGAFEAAEAVRQAAAQKPVIAIVNGMAASAGYAIASAATKIVTTPTGLSGSIGVLMMHADYSRSLDKAGITPTLIFAGENKVDGNPFEPLPDDVRARLQAEVDGLYDAFIQTVAQGRKAMSPAAIRGTNARVFIGQQAVDVGLADEVGTFESVLLDVTRASSRASPPRTQGARRMSDISLEAHNTAVTAARDEGVAAARTARADGERAGAEAERTRIQGIIGHAEASGREAQALAIAMTGATVEQAGAVLAASPKTAATTSTTLADRASTATATMPAPAAAGGTQQHGVQLSDHDKGKAIAERFK